jgi:hypothetical protein
MRVPLALGLVALAFANSALAGDIQGIATYARAKKLASPEPDQLYHTHICVYERDLCSGEMNLLGTPTLRTGNDVQGITFVGQFAANEAVAGEPQQQVFRGVMVVLGVSESSDCKATLFAKILLAEPTADNRPLTEIVGGGLVILGETIRFRGSVKEGFEYVLDVKPDRWYPDRRRR